MNKKVVSRIAFTNDYILLKYFIQLKKKEKSKYKLSNAIISNII